MRDFDVIGISSFSTMFDSTIELIKQIKSEKNIVIVGGHHISLAPMEVMGDVLEIDYGIIGFGEYSFPKLLENINSVGLENVNSISGLCYRIDNEIKVNPVSYKGFDLNKLEYPDRSLMVQDYNSRECYKHVSTRNFATSRGCPYKCTYCVNCSQNHWLSRTPENVLEEIKLEYTQSPFEHIVFTDCNFFSRA